MITNKISYDVDSENAWIKFSVTKKQMSDFFAKYKEGKPYDVEIRQHRIKRSLNANAYCWKLIGEIAEELSNDNASYSNYDIYEEMLKRYSKAFTYIVVKPEFVEATKATLKESHIYAYEIEGGTVKINGKDGIQLQLFFGSSTFNTKQMARLIDGIVSEAKELGIETETHEQIENMKSLWEEYNVD